MSSEWEIFSIGQLTVNHDSRRIPVKGPDRKPGIFPYYGASGIVDWVDQYIFSGEFLLVAEDGENLRTRNTPVAFMATGKFWVNNHAHILQGNERADTRFLSYLLEGTDISGYLTGSTIPKLSQGNLNAIEVVVPGIYEQKAIAHVLGTLDDKIELNRKTNETLEGIAKALFKSWFVDFDPVRAKAEGRPTGLPDEISDLFPDSFEQSELGEIPSGWEVKTVEEIAEKVAMGPFGSNIKVSTFVDTGIPVISGQHLKGAILHDGGNDFITPEHAEKLKNSCVEKGDIIFTHAGSIGQVSLIPVNSEYERYVISQRQFYLRPISGNLSHYLVMFFR